MKNKEVWEKIHNSKEWGKYPSIEVVRFIANNYYNKQRDKIKILDFGCGQGANTWFLANENFDTYAFDISESAIYKAKERLNNMKLKANFSTMNGTNLQYSNDVFDSVIDCAAIYNNIFSDILLMYKETYRVLKFGGKLFSTGLWNVKTTGYGTGEFLERNTYNNLTLGALSNLGIVHFFTREELNESLKKIGFKNISIDEKSEMLNNNLICISQYIVSAEK